MRSLYLTIRALLSTGCACDECVAIIATKEYIKNLRLIGDRERGLSLDLLNKCLVPLKK